MESGVIREICRQQKIPAATVRIISDIASEDLPMDFNRFRKEGGRISYGKIALSMMGQPDKIPSLIQFQRQTSSAASSLAEFLSRLIGGK